MPTPSLKSRARHVAGRALRRSPVPVQRALTASSETVLRALDAYPQPPAPPPARRPVWRTPDVPTPDGLTFDEVVATMRSWSINDEPIGHMDGYVADSCLRFLYTWDQVRHETGSCLELGANPYFTTWLLDEHTDLDLTLANYYGAPGESHESVSWLPPGSDTRRTVVRDSVLFNVEEERFPYDDDTFDAVLFCEMIEHMLMDPLATLREIHRVLKPTGVMLLTTPNVARLENVLRLIVGENLYDPYSGYGPYGRHNREFTRAELVRLLEFAGFEVESAATADGHPMDHAALPGYQKGAPLLRSKARRQDLGHYFFLRGRPTGTPREGLPSFLYRSYPDGVVVDY